MTKSIEELTKENIALQEKVDNLNRGMQNLMESQEKNNKIKDAKIEELRTRFRKAETLVDSMINIYV